MLIINRQTLNLHGHTLDLGTRLVRTKKGIFSRHHVVYVGYINGIPMVVENQQGKNIQYIPLSQFLNEGILERVESFQGSEYQRNRIIPRINECLGRSYSLILFNCEHFATFILTGQKESRQVQNAVAVGLAAFAILVIAKAVDSRA
jgi:hypothetical protein